MIEANYISIDDVPDKWRDLVQKLFDEQQNKESAIFTDDSDNEE